MVTRFKETVTVHTKKSPGPTKTKSTEENITRIKNMIEETPSTSMRKLCSESDISSATVWRILRKALKLFPYKPKTVQPLTQAHRAGRMEFCRWISEKSPEFVDKVLWSDEKLCEEKIRPNKQNEMYWWLVDPEVEDECMGEEDHVLGRTC